MSNLYINVIQHLAFEDLGSFEQVFQQQGFEIRYFHAGVNIPAEIYLDPAILIVLGGPIGVYETDTYPYLQYEIEGLKQRIAKDFATLGICLGAQLIAAACGAKVFGGHYKEIGFSRLNLSDAGFASPLKYLDGVYVLHWHGDTFDLPDQARHLASSIYYKQQAFAIGRKILALQFHVELNPANFEQWLIGHCCELHHAQVDVVALREENVRYGKDLVVAAEKLLKDWLANV